MLWEQGEQAGSKGSKLGVRGASWGLPEACPERLQGSRDALGAMGVSWGLPEAPGRFQRSRDGLGARGGS